jgi:hypothetical protein
MCLEEAMLLLLLLLLQDRIGPWCWLAGARQAPALPWA